jgi:hypothetical protein
MSKSRVWQSAATLLFATAVSLSLSVGCSKQGEGERCDRAKAGDSDCEDGLKCDKVDGQDRCCPPPGAPISDSRCQSTGIIPVGGNSGTGGGSSASGGNGEAGATNVSGGQTSSAGAGGQTSSAGAEGG